MPLLFDSILKASTLAAAPSDLHDMQHIMFGLGVQVTSDQYLNLSPFMDAIKATLEKKLADKQLLPKL